MSPRNHTIRTTLALTMALGAVVPAAHARVAVEPVSSSPQDVKSAQDLRRAAQTSSVQDVKAAQDLRRAAQTSSLAGTVDPGRQTITVSTPNGFDWGDAAIGAAGGLGLALAAVGGSLAVERAAEAHAAAAEVHRAADEADGAVGEVDRGRAAELVDAVVRGGRGPGDRRLTIDIARAHGDARGLQTMGAAGFEPATSRV